MVGNRTSNEIMEQTQDLESKRKQFVRLVSDGVRPVLAANMAGIGSTVDSSRTLADRLMNRPEVLAEINRRAANRLTGYLVPLSTKTLERILRSPETPAQHQIAAAKLVFQAAGALAAERPDVSVHSDGSGRATQAEVAKLTKALSDLRAQKEVLLAILNSDEPVTIDVTPGVAPELPDFS